MKRTIIGVIIVFHLLSVTGCNIASWDPFSIDSVESYQDIPGVTEEEIIAIGRRH